MLSPPAVAKTTQWPPIYCCHEESHLRTRIKDAAITNTAPPPATALPPSATSCYQLPPSATAYHHTMTTCHLLLPPATICHLLLPSAPICHMLHLIDTTLPLPATTLPPSATSCSSHLPPSATACHHTITICRLLLPPATICHCLLPHYLHLAICGHV